MHPLRFAASLILILASLMGSLPAQAAGADWTPLMERLVADGFNADEMKTLFARPDVQFDPAPMSSKLQALINKREKRRGPAGPSLRAVYRGFLQPEVIRGARSFAEENRPILAEVRRIYCVPDEIVVAILLVETHLGKHLGKRSAFNTLASMSLARDFQTIQPHLPEHLVNTRNEGYAKVRCREKADWAYRELKALIRYAEKSGQDPVQISGSIYGAIGLCQFMPTNAFLYGVDVQQKGRVDLFAKPDALHSIGNYLSKNGWRCRMNQKGQHRVVMTYNHSHLYANTVLAVAQRLKQPIGKVAGAAPVS